MLKFSGYFLFTRDRVDRKIINMEWIEQVYYHPEFEEIQEDGRLRRWGYIKEINRYLRVVVLEDKVTIHNAFIDRSFKR
jgi:hypothetical protein